MRQKSLAAVVTIALAGAIAFSVIGQEEPLPVMAPKYVAPQVTIVEPLVVLASEPVREYQPPTILEAARNNDYLTFDALYIAAKKRGEDVTRFDTLHELWTYSVTDPIGAFYGPELHARLSQAYPGFEAYIEPYRIVDDRGQLFYPTSETRSFLLARAAIEGRPAAPRVQVAEDHQLIPPRPKPAPAVTPSVARGPAARVAATPPPPRSLAPARDDVKVEPAPAVAEQPVVIAAEPAPAPVVKQPVATPAPGPAPVQAPANRGILLVIIGLIGIGLLAVILRTPKEEPLVIKPNNVEPIRKAPAPAQPGERATGSHG